MFHIYMCYLIAKLDIFHQAIQCCDSLDIIFWNIDYGPWIELATLSLALSISISLQWTCFFCTKSKTHEPHQSRIFQCNNSKKLLAFGKKKRSRVRLWIYYCWAKWHVNITNREFYELNFIYLQACDCSIAPLREQMHGCTGRTKWRGSLSAFTK